MKRSRPIQPAPWNTRERQPKQQAFIDPVLRQQVKDREHGCCALCAERLPAVWECHHRQLRSRGGLDIITNLIALDRVCHGRLHARPAYATEHGFMVASHDDPAQVPVALHLARWVLLLPDGTYRTADAA